MVGNINSKMIEQELNRFTPKIGTGDLIISVQTLSPLQIPITTTVQENKIEKWVDDIIALKQAGKPTKDLEKRLCKNLQTLRLIAPRNSIAKCCKQINRLGYKSV